MQSSTPTPQPTPQAAPPRMARATDTAVRPPSPQYVRDLQQRQRSWRPLARVRAKKLHASSGAQPPQLLWRMLEKPRHPHTPTCTAVKGDQRPPQEEWRCSYCEEYNYMTRNKCRKCDGTHGTAATSRTTVAATTAPAQPGEIAGAPTTPKNTEKARPCHLYTSDAADDLLCVDLGRSPSIQTNNNEYTTYHYLPSLRRHT